ncbi:MAG: competence/damage-inducible protein A [Betaproteobacteria bacterium HGW-Betaproteobacteria-10]|jgi:molybdopterin-biosynthesis enzyme MoeA-like protein|nr:MAG: competence/damage-inducible protein A [Betaproteobacteria bacterium HGW-Betaproteobacteria-10]
MSCTFGAIIIGDEIMSGKRQDKHFAKITEILGARGLMLSWVEYLGDDRARLAATFKRTMASGDVVFSCGGIGNTPDDHTRQAVAAALGVGLAVHPQAFAELKLRFANEEISEQRQQLVTFPVGVDMVPNPFNRIAGFTVNEHYFVPGFPQMAHPMIEWALDTFYKNCFQAVGRKIDKAFLLTGPNAYESALLDLMERVVNDYPTLRLFSLPSLNGTERRHLELGVEGEPGLVEKALAEIRLEIEKRGITWAWRP